jgi:oxygen-dependent protoporphyrinogen oxidase
LIETVHKDGFTFETGPRAVRYSEFSSNILDIAADLNLVPIIKVSEATSKQANIYADDHMTPLLAPPPFSKLKTLMRPELLRTVLKNVVPRIAVNPVEDESIDQFVRKVLRFWSEEDADYIINTYLDAIVQGVYSGDITKLSARSCSPFRSAFHKRYFGMSMPTLTPSSSRARGLFLDAKQKDASAFTFAGGLGVLVEKLLEHLTSLPDFTLVPERAVSLFSKTVKTASGKEIAVDHVISTLPAFNLSSLFDWSFADFKSMSNEVPYNSLWSINLGYQEPLNLTVRHT